MSTAASVEVRGLHMVVAHPPDRAADRLVRLLQRLGARVELQWPPPDRLHADVSVLFCVVEPVVQRLLHVPASGAGPAVIAVVNPHDAGSLRLLDDAAPHAVLVAPMEPGAVIASLVVARANLQVQRRHLAKIARLEETLRSHRQVEQAKAILMERRHIGEPEAYGYLRDQAMRRRVPIGVVATLVVESNEMLPEATE